MLWEKMDWQSWAATPTTENVHAMMVCVRAFTGGKSQVQPLSDERNNSSQGHDGGELNSLNNQMQRKEGPRARLPVLVGDAASGCPQEKVLTWSSAQEATMIDSHTPEWAPLWKQEHVDAEQGRMADIQPMVGRVLSPLCHPQSMWRARVETVLLYQTTPGSGASAQIHTLPRQKGFIIKIPHGAIIRT